MPLGGSSNTGVDAPQFTLLEDRIGSPVAEITQNGGDSLFSTPVNQYSAYVQDDFHVSRRLVVNLGLRYDFWSGFDLDQRTNPIWQALSTQTQFSESYLQDFQGGTGGVHHGPAAARYEGLQGGGERRVPDRVG